MTNKYTARAGCILIHAIVCLVLTDYSLAESNPADPKTPKRCARLKNTIEFQGPICVKDNISKSFTEDSLTNCEIYLKGECPEFNEGACVETITTPLRPDSSRSKTGGPFCRLRYFDKPSNSSWMEVYYVNQFRNIVAGDIIEIHRVINNPKVFGAREQPDYPENVIDAKGERGLQWTELKDPKPFTFKTTPAMCQKDINSVSNSDPRCGLINISDTVYQYLLRNYADGFDPAGNAIAKSPRETQMNPNITKSHISDCANVTVGNANVRACRTFFTRNAVYADKGASPPTSFVFLESQVYTDADNKTKLRYAYWHQEDAKTRDQIFTDKDWYATN